MKTSFRWFGVAVLSLLPAFADPVTVSVYASLAPNNYGSPSWSAYAANAIAALENGWSTVGDPATDPSAYYQVTEIYPNNNVVTDFPSWNGYTDPTGAFANELGNRLHFGLVVQGNGTQFSLSNLSFEMHSNDGNDMFWWVDSFSSADVYSNTRAGYVNGVGYITSGSADQLVDALYYVGVGNAAPVDESAPGATNQKKIENVLNGAPIFDCGAPCGMPLPPYQVTTTYMLSDGFGNELAEGSGIVKVSPIPEPSALILLVTTFGLACILTRRKTARQQ